MKETKSQGGEQSERLGALLDPPDRSSTLQEWIDFRAELECLPDVPALSKFKCEADRVIAKKQREALE